MENNNYKNIPVYVLCPGNAESGGPELLHQLVDSLRKINIEASIVYYPFDDSFNKPKKFEEYNAPQIKYSDIIKGKIIVSEVSTKLIRYFKSHEIIIWWASIDFYFGIAKDYVILDLIRYFRSLFFRRLPLFRLKKYKHYCQSLYAQNFLRNKGINAEILSDYLNKSHNTRPITKRKNLIAYNPSKGINVTNALINANPDFEFVPIQNMTPHEVSNLLSSSKIYIDFGNHPGKDRMPREAALSGCCVITGIKGSAGFDDILIPSRYKINDIKVNYKSNHFNEQFRKLVSHIFKNYDICAEEFNLYRETISKEEMVFNEQVKKLFGEKYE